MENGNRENYFLTGSGWLLSAWETSQNSKNTHKRITEDCYRGNLKHFVFIRFKFTIVIDNNFQLFSFALHQNEKSKCKNERKKTMKCSLKNSIEQLIDSKKTFRIILYGGCGAKRKKLSEKTDQNFNFSFQIALL